jgi:hypothetical protein
MIHTPTKFKLNSALLVVSLGISSSVFAIPSFPGAVGRGAITPGGRAVIDQNDNLVGHVYRVTKLSDDGSAGTLRYGLKKAKDHTTIVFDVGGIIHLEKKLAIKNNFITIAGQTAPGEGITIAGYPVSIGKDCPKTDDGVVYWNGYCNTEGGEFGQTDIIIRYVRFRLGDWNVKGRPANPDKGIPAKPHSPETGPGFGGDGGDPLVIQNSHRIMLDHISASWGIDETLDVSFCSSVTIQNSIISEGLLDSYHPKGLHSRGLLSTSFDKISVLNEGKGGYTLFGNLIASNNMRNPLFGSVAKFKRKNDGEDKDKVPLTNAEKDPQNPDALFQRMDFINNVVSNWGVRNGHSGRPNTLLNYVNNYLIGGPSTDIEGSAGGGNNSEVAVREEDKDEGTFRLYREGNVVDFNRNTIHDGIPATSDAFQGFEPGEVVSEPLSHMLSIAHFVEAENAYGNVLNHAGASLQRDAIDSRIVNEVETRTGRIIDTQGQLGPIDEVSRPANFDTDKDGIPNTWEIREGLDPDNQEDGKEISISDEGYTNLEVYLNKLVPGPVVD